MIQYILYGLNKKENKPYLEDIIYISKNKEDLKKAEQIAIKKGFHSFRIAKTDLNEKPNFTNILNIPIDNKIKSSKKFYDKMIQESKIKLIGIK